MVEEKKDVPPTEAQVKNEETLAKIEGATEKLDKANAEYAKNKAEADAEKADKALEGESEAGADPKKKEMSDKEYSEKVMAGEVPETK